MLASADPRTLADWTKQDIEVIPIAPCCCDGYCSFTPNQIEHDWPRVARVLERALAR